MSHRFPVLSFWPPDGGNAVVVLCKSQFYYFSALWPGTGHVAVDEADILDILEAIQKHAGQTDSSERSKSAIGVLTSLPRSKWAVSAFLLAWQKNSASLHAIVLPSWMAFGLNFFMLIVRLLVPGCPKRTL